jgi:hypothetical protein
MPEVISELKADTYKNVIKHAAATADFSSKLQHASMGNSSDKKIDKLEHLYNQHKKSVALAKKLLWNKHKQTGGSGLGTPDVHKTAVKRVADKIKEENLQELNKSTLGSYVKKASDDMANHSSDASTNSRDSVTSAVKGDNKASSELQRAAKYHSKKVLNRSKGISRAVDRITKEEVEQIDELNDSTLKSYKKKSMQSALHHSYMAASDELHGKKNSKHKLKVKNRMDGIVRAGVKLSKEEFLGFALYVAEEDKESAVPSYTTGDAAEAAAQSYYQRAKQTPDTEPEKKKHFMYIARKLYSQAKRLRKNKPKEESYEVNLGDGNILQISEDLYEVLESIEEIDEDVFKDIVSFNNFLESLEENK